MCGGRDSSKRGGKDGRGGRSGGRSQTIINGVDISDTTRNFTVNEWTSLGWNGGWAYVFQCQERMNGRGSGIRGGDRDGGRKYGCGGAPHNVKKLTPRKLV